MEPALTERWRRFTLLDCLLLFPCFALGFAGVEFVQRLGPPTREAVLLRWQAAMLFLFGILLGSTLAGPTILLVQRFVRRRNVGLSVGEWLWLCPGAMLVLGCIATGFAYANIWGAAVFCGYLAGVTQLLGSLLACVEIYFRLFRLDDAVPCLWTDVFGSIVCAGTGVFAFVLLAMDSP